MAVCTCTLLPIILRNENPPKASSLNIPVNGLYELHRTRDRPRVCRYNSHANFYKLVFAQTQTKQNILFLFLDGRGACFC